MNNELRYFQWIAGDRRGEVMIFDKLEVDGPDVFIVFKDGSRINENLVAPINKKDLTGKFMAEIDDPQNLWKFQEECVGREEEKWEQNAEGVKVCVQPFVPGRKIIKLIPPKPTPPNHSIFGKIENTVSPPPEPEHEYISTFQPKVDTSDPVYILMSKSKKIDSEITMNITISLPQKDLYNIAKQSFEDGDKKFISYIVSNISVEGIKDAIKIAIKDMYEKDSNEAI